jgi:carbamoyltransferase
VPVLLNTSFNDREPIVESPEDAVRCFLSTGIDVLYLENLRVTKAGRGGS